MKTNAKRVGAQIVMLVIALGIVYAIGAIGYCVMMVGCEPWGLIILAVAIALSGWLVLSVLHYICNKRTWVVVVLFFSLYSYSIYTYRNIDNSCRKDMTETVDIILPINNTLSIFFPSRGSYSENDYTTTDFNYQAIHLLSYLFFAMLAFSFFGRRVINRSGFRLIRYNHRNIFWEDSPGGMLLAQNLIDTTVIQQAIFVVSDTIKEEGEKDKALFEGVDSMGAIVLYRNFQKKSRIPRGAKHFFLTEDQDFNVVMALKVAENNKNNRRKVKLYVRTEMENIGQLFPVGSNIEVNIFNQSDLTARQFVQEKPILDIVPTEKKVDLKVDYNFRVLVLGFGWTGREMLNKIICDSQFVGSSFSATILDKDFHETQGDYPLLYDECIKEYNLFFESKEISTIGSSASYQWLEEKIKNYDRIFVTLGDDNLNLETGIAISRLFFKQEIYDTASRIFVQIKDPEKYCYSNLSVSLFGRLDEIYTVDVVINEQMDIVAKGIDYVYSRWKEDSIPYNDILNNIMWQEKSINNVFNQNSSRAAAAGVLNLVKFAGGIDSLTSTLNDVQKMKILAECEHLRWNAFHFTKGIRVWNINDIPNDRTENVKMTTNGLLVKHGCLVSFQELKNVSDYSNDNSERSGGNRNVDFQKVDHRIIRHFGLFYQILKSNENK